MFISCPVHRAPVVSIRLISVQKNRIRFDACQKTPVDLPCVLHAQYIPLPLVTTDSFLRFPLEIKSLRTRVYKKLEINVTFRNEIRPDVIPSSCSVYICTYKREGWPEIRSI